MDQSGSAERSRRTGLATVTIVVSALLALPAFTGTDDFPVSSQPMFAEPRSETAEFLTARGIDVDGQTVRLSISELAATDDPLVAESVFINADRESRLTLLCQDILERSGERVVAVEIVRSRHDLDAGFAEFTALDVDVLERCGST